MFWHWDEWWNIVKVKWKLPHQYAQTVVMEEGEIQSLWTGNLHVEWKAEERKWAENRIIKYQHSGKSDLTYVMFICRFPLGKFLKKYNLSHSNLNRKGICRMEFLGRLENKKWGNNNSTIKSQAARTTEPHLECSLRTSTIL